MSGTRTAEAGAARARRKAGALDVVPRLLRAVTATLDREVPRWRFHEPAARVAVGWPEDDRALLERLARTLLPHVPARDDAFGFHPELLARAEDDDLRRVAERLGQQVGALARLRAHARRMSAGAERNGAFLPVLWSAWGEGRPLPDRALERDCEAALLARVAERARRPARGAAVRDPVARWLRRVGVDPGSDVAAALQRARPRLLVFTVPASGVCGSVPCCARCEVAAAGLCTHARALGLPSRGAAHGNARAPATERARRGETLVRLGAARLSVLEARVLALTTRKRPWLSFKRRRWCADIKAASESLHLAIAWSRARIFQGIRALEPREGADVARRVELLRGMLGRLERADAARRRFTSRAGASKE